MCEMKNVQRHSDLSDVPNRTVILSSDEILSLTLILEYGHGIWHEDVKLHDFVSLFEEHKDIPYSLLRDLWNEKERTLRSI